MTLEELWFGKDEDFIGKYRSDKTNTKAAGNYVIYHLHSDLSNGVTNVDSVTKFGEYIEAAKECGMKAMGFAEHGSLFEWWHKKCAIENAGMKYIHAVEAYLTESLDEKVRDNYHCVLIAKNYDGFLELNRLVSNSFNRNDNHFYYTPRISFDELFQTSNNIIITSACIGGVFGKGDDSVKSKMLSFFSRNKDRCFLEIGHHIDQRQIDYNNYLVKLAEEHGLRLIAGTDTHVLNERHEKGRSILQASKKIFFEGEERWDLKFKSFEELIKAYRRQGSLPEEVYLEAINNTNVLADMIEPFELDRGTKYPHIYENPEQVFREKIDLARAKHKYVNTTHDKEELDAVINEEFEVYKATKSIDFMLLQTYMREWEAKNGIECGYGRGSVSGSEIAYILGITQMDSMKFGLNFFRFMNPSRVTNADIDTDYSGADRDNVKEFLLKDKMNLPNINSAEIITFNTIALKGAVRDVCRALYKDKDGVDYLSLSSEINNEVELHEDEVRMKYPEIFEYVDIINGTIVSVGTHPSGVLISDLPIWETVGLCSLSTSDYPVSMLNMKELDDLMYVKLDILGLDNIGAINDTCKMVGIDRLTPDNVDLEDENVWKSIRDNTTLIFQWESNSAQQYIKRFMSDKTLDIARKRVPNFSMMKWLSFGNGLLRPACASFRDSVANGEFYDNGFDALNEFLAPEAGRIAMQETIMRFLVKFCGYSDAESDTVRRAIAKKYGTEKLLPEIKERFIKFCPCHYDITEEKAAEIIEPFLQIILDASAYGFSWNHSDAYSCIGYISGYLRYYYPYEFITCALNTFSDDTEKTAQIMNYAARNKIRISLPKWGLSRDCYSYSKKDNVITKGLQSVKFLNSTVAEELYSLSMEKTYGKDEFMFVLRDIFKYTSLNTRQLDILIKIDFFSEFGNQRELLYLTDLFCNMFKKGEVKMITKDIQSSQMRDIIAKYSNGYRKDGKEAKSFTIMDIDSILRETESSIKSVHMPDLENKLKIENFKEAMGYYGYSTGLEEDRKKLYIVETYPLKRKSDGKRFGYSVITQSIGSGKESRFTVFNKLFEKDPIKKGDIIYCKKYASERGYFTLLDYYKDW